MAKFFLKNGSVLFGPILLGMIGCGPGAQVEPVVRLDVQDIGFAEPALARSVDAFIGDRGDGFSNGSDPADNPSREPNGNEQQSADETLGGVKFRVRDLHEVSAGVKFYVHSDDIRNFALRLIGGRGRAEVYLPEGVDIFVDPITVTAKTHFLETALIFEQRLFPQNSIANRIKVMGEVGHRQTKSKVSLRSALIRRDDTGSDNQVFVGVGMRIAFGSQRNTSLDLGLRRIREGTAIARVGVERRF